MKTGRSLSDGFQLNDLSGIAVSQYTDVLQVRIELDQTQRRRNSWLERYPP